MSTSPKILKHDDLELYDYVLTKRNVDAIFNKYRQYKEKAGIITKRVKSALSNDNLGIFSSSISNPTANKVEQLDRLTRFLNEVDTVIKTFSNELTREERLYLDKGLKLKMETDDLGEIISVSYVTLVTIRKSCYIKVARWFDIEVYSDNE